MITLSACFYDFYLQIYSETLYVSELSPWLLKWYLNCLFAQWPFKNISHIISLLKLFQVLLQSNLNSSRVDKMLEDMYQFFFSVFNSIFPWIYDVIDTLFPSSRALHLLFPSKTPFFPWLSLRPSFQALGYDMLWFFISFLYYQLFCHIISLSSENSSSHEAVCYDYFIFLTRI
jgi:hypothetical protein